MVRQEAKNVFGVSRAGHPEIPRIYFFLPPPASRVAILRKMVMMYTKMMMIYLMKMLMVSM